MSAESTGIDETYYPPFPWCSVRISNLSKKRNVTVRFVFEDLKSTKFPITQLDSCRFEEEIGVD